MMASRIVVSSSRLCASRNALATISACFRYCSNRSASTENHRTSGLRSVRTTTPPSTNNSCSIPTSPSKWCNIRSFSSNSNSSSSALFSDDEGDATTTTTAVEGPTDNSHPPIVGTDDVDEVDIPWNKIRRPKHATTSSSSSSSYHHSSVSSRRGRRSWHTSGDHQQHYTSSQHAPQQQFYHDAPPHHWMVPVSAIHAAQTIELQPLLTSSSELVSIKKQMFGKNSIVIQLANKATREMYNPQKKTATYDSATSTTTSDMEQQQQQPLLTTSVVDAPRYVAIFRFGSIVFFNVEPREADRITSLVKRYASGAVEHGTERKENFGVLVTNDNWEVGGSSSSSAASVNNNTNTDSTLTNAATSAAAGNTTVQLDDHHPSSSTSVPYETVTGDYCTVNELDMNGVAVIGTIMGQTVALDRYSDTVDELLTNFARINSTVSKTGSFTSTDKSFLFKTVAQNNSIVIDMISKVRIKDRSDTAWNLTKYQTIHYGLKEEFELDDRFENIEFKLNLIEKNAKFFLDVMHHQKSNNLEWIIVALILAECILMCVEMSGMSGALVNALSGLLPSALVSRRPTTSTQHTTTHQQKNEESSPSPS